MIRIFILIAVVVSFYSCGMLTRTTGLKSIKFLKRNVHIEDVAQLKLDSSWSILIERDTLLKGLDTSLDTLLSYEGVSELNDTLIIDLKGKRNDKLPYVESIFKKELLRKNGLCYNYIENKFKFTVVYEKFRYYYGRKAAGSGWQYRIIGTDIILSRRYKWIS